MGVAVKDPSIGPIPRSKFREIAALPYGRAAKEIRKYDPMWGLAQGEKIEFRVECRGTMTGVAYVKASSQEEAEKAADELTGIEVDWDYDDGIDIISVEPKKP